LVPKEPQKLRGFLLSFFQGEKELSRENSSFFACLILFEFEGRPGGGEKEGAELSPKMGDG
jgi:hypothetical protein